MLQALTAHDRCSGDVRSVGLKSEKAPSGK